MYVSIAVLVRSKAISRAGNEPWKITKLGLNRGLVSWIFWISFFKPSRMLLAI